MLLIGEHGDYGRLLLQSSVDDRGDSLGVVATRTTGTKLVVQTLNATIQEAPTPFVGRLGRDPDSFGHGPIGPSLFIPAGESGIPPSPKRRTYYRAAGRIRGIR